MSTETIPATTMTLGDAPLDTQPETKLTLRKFDMSKIRKEDDPTILIIGRRRAGKGVLAKDLLHHLRYDVDSVLDIPPTTDEDEGERKVSAFLEKQQATSTGSTDNHALIAYRPPTKIGKSLEKAIVRGRYNNTGVLSFRTWPRAIGPVIRAQFDYIFLFWEGEHRSLRFLWEEWAGMFPTFASFQHTMKQVCQDHGCLVLDRTISSSALEDQVFWYKAPI